MSLPPQPKKKNAQKPKKGDPRKIVKLSEVEIAVFGDRADPEKVYGRQKNRARRGVPDADEWTSVDMLDEKPSNHASHEEEDFNDARSFTDGSIEDLIGGVDINDHVRPLQNASDVNFSVGGERGWGEKIAETPEMLQKRREGQKRADEKELVKKAARRAVVFGVWVEHEAKEGKGRREHKAREEEPQKVRRKCEALMNGQVVEPSFAKGDWSFRWRED